MSPFPLRGLPGLLHIRGHLLRGIATLILTASSSVLSIDIGNRALGAEFPKKPNVIFMMADDLGYGDLGCYGQKKIQTPNIDQMAEEGMRFTDAYAGSTVCAPSRCTLMTGLHTGHCRVRGNWYLPLRPEDVTVAEVAKSAGYRTAIFGKWGLGEPGTTGIPTRQGFDQWFGYLNQHHAHNYYPVFLWRNELKAAITGNVVRPVGTHGGGVATEKVTYSHDLFVAEALRFLDENKDKPFFLYLPFTIPHANNQAGKEGMEVPSLAQYENKPWPAAQKGHAAMISRLDSDVGRILDKLKQLKIDENTLVIFTSDNGPHREGGADPDFFNSSGPLQGIKRSLHDGGIRVPMIARMPGTVKTGSTSDHALAFWDLLPTVAELVGTKSPEGLDGISFVPTLIGENQPQHEFLYWEFYERERPIGVRHGHWKAVRPRPSAALQLYDLRKDLHEDHNLAKQYPEVVAKIEAYLKTCSTEPEIPARPKKK